MYMRQLLLFFVPIQVGSIYVSCKLNLNQSMIFDVRGGWIMIRQAVGVWHATASSVALQ